jgi:hypothetical protein
MVVAITMPASPAYSATSCRWRDGELRNGEV